MSTLPATPATDGPLTDAPPSDAPPADAPPADAVATALAQVLAVPEEDLLPELCRAARALVDGGSSGVALPDGDELVVVAVATRLPSQRTLRDVGGRLPSKGSVAGQVLRSGVGEVVHDTRTHRLGGLPLNDFEDIRSSVAVPVRLPGRGTVAVLSVLSTVPGSLGARELDRLHRLLEAVPDARLAAAVDAANARLGVDGEQLYRAVLESLEEGVVVHGTTGQVLLHNRAAARLLGLTPDELVGRALADPRWCLCDLDGSPLVVDDYPAARALRTGQEDRDRLLLLRRPDGEERVMSVTSLPRRDGTGTVFSAVVSFQDVTDAHRLAERAQEQARRLAAAMELADLATWQTTLGTDEWEFSERLHSVAGVAPGTTVSDQAVRDWFGPAVHARMEAEWALVLRDRTPRQVTVDVRAADSSTRTVSVWLDLTCDDDGVPVRQWGVVQDVTDRVTALRDVQRSEEVFRLAFDGAPIGMIMLDADGSGRVVRSNAAFRRMLRRPGDDSTDPMCVADWTRPEDLTRDMDRVRDFVRGDREHDALEKTYVRADGTTFEALVTSSMARGPDGRPLHVLAHVTDVSERAAHARELERLALTDDLTGLPNRRLMEDRLEQALARLTGPHGPGGPGGPGAEGGLVGLVLLDLDHFKVVNDSLGHAVGDSLLVEVAGRLRAAVRPGTTVARLGGDEFVAVVDEARDHDDVAAVGAHLLGALREPFTLGPNRVVVTASLGLAVSGGCGTPSELLRQADLALYRAKATGRDRVVGFDAELRTRVDARLAAESMVRDALAGGWLRLHLQPVVDLVTGRQVGAEALVRLQHPGRGLLLPGEFVEVAEETGLITEIDAWVLEAAVRLLARHPGTRLAVNVSARTVEAGGLAERIRAVTDAHGVDASRLDVELTETSLFTRAQGVAEDVARVRHVGARVGLDDFGTGYSALAHLQTFELDFLKVDRSFIARLGDGGVGDGAAAVVAAVVALAHAHHLDVVAEGVETEQQRDLLRGMGCDQAQGWLLGRPAPPA